MPGAGGAQRGPAAALLQVKGTAGGGEVPARQPDVSAMLSVAGGDKGSPNLQLPALTKSLIIFKFRE